MTPERAMSAYLTFDNALMVWFTISLVIVMLFYARWRINYIGGICVLLEYVRTEWLRDQKRGRGGENTAAVLVLMFGLAMRSGSIVTWRYSGSVPADFPFYMTAIGGVGIDVGILWLIGIMAKNRPFNWPWILTLVSGLVFGLLVLTFASPAASHQIEERDAAVMIRDFGPGDCAPAGRRGRLLLAAGRRPPGVAVPTSRRYDGGVACGDLAPR